MAISNGNIHSPKKNRASFKPCSDDTVETPGLINLKFNKPALHKLIKTILQNAQASEIVDHGNLFENYHLFSTYRLHLIRCVFVSTMLA